jgi:hypothetical protein
MTLLERLSAVARKTCLRIGCMLPAQRSQYLQPLTFLTSLLVPFASLALTVATSNRKRSSTLLPGRKEITSSARHVELFGRKQYSLSLSAFVSGVHRRLKLMQVIYATNAYSAQLKPELKDIIVPVRGQVVATSPLLIDFPVSLVIRRSAEYMIQRRNDKRVIFGGMRYSC